MFIFGKIDSVFEDKYKKGVELTLYLQGGEQDMARKLDFDKETFKKEVVNNVKTLYRKTSDEGTQEQVF